LVLFFAVPGWGTEPGNVSFLDLSDRDVIILNTGDVTLESGMMVNKLSPSRLEVLYRYDGQIPAVPQVSGDLVTAIDVSPRKEGFMLVLTLSDAVPTTGEAAYRETELGNGRTAIEVFTAASTRSAFDPSWLDSGQRAPLTAPLAAPLGESKYSGATYSEADNTLVIHGVGRNYELKEHAVTGRVDVHLNGATTTDTGLVHKNNDGKVTYVDVVPSKVSDGLVVRTRLSSNVGLVSQEVRGEDLYLSFGTPSSALLGNASDKAGPAAYGTTETTDEQKAWAPAASGNEMGNSLSASIGAVDPARLEKIEGVSGQRQAVPSVDQILQMAKEDAYRYGKDGSSSSDSYGSYQLPGFAGDEDLLSEVRVNLNAAGGFSLYQFLMFMSDISGISIVIDPYWLDDPTGNTVRDPQDPGQLPGGGDGGPGFRSADIFFPQLGGTGSIVGNLVNIPFDQALNLVLSTHNLKKVVYRDPADPYSRPVILITSKERLEQELEGTNEIALYQLHYADPFQLEDILDDLNLLPGVDSGWYVYRGRGNRGNGGGGGGQGGGGQGGGGQGGGGRGGGGGGGRNDVSLDTAINMGDASRGQYFNTSQTGPMQAIGGGGGVGGGGGGQGGGGGGQGGQGGGGGGQGGGNQVGLPTAKSGLVVMRGTPDTLSAIQSLIARIDRPPKQVAINVKVYQVSEDPEKVWGLLRATGQKDRITAPYESGSLTVNVLPKGGVLLDENYSAAFDFLQTERKAKLVTEQEIMVVDGFNANMTNTRTRGQLSGTLVVTPDGQVINQPQFNSVTVGTTLNFTPQIDDRGRVTMTLTVNLSNFDGPQQEASANGQQVTFQPTINTNLQTVLRIVDGQTVLIGGLSTTEDSKTFSGIPFLSKLPIIGQFFGHHREVKNESHIYITIQGNIVDDK
jgi:hypothetical protein